MSSSATPHLRLLSLADVDVLNHVAPGVFDHAVDPPLASEFLADPRHHITVAILDGCVIGMASAVHYVHPDKPPQLWINEVGVAPAHQRQGIAQKLLHTLLSHARKLGCTEAWVLADEQNTAARHLYTSHGATASPSLMFSFPLTDPSH